MEDVRNIYVNTSGNDVADIYVLKNDDTVWTFGNEVYSPEKLFDGIANVVIMHSGNFAISNYVLFQTTDGRLLNKLGDVILDKVKLIDRWRNNDVSSPGFSPVIVFSDGSLYFVNGNFPKTVSSEDLIEKLQNVAKLSTAGNNIVNGVLWAILDNNELWAIGQNHYGELGDGTKIPRKEFVKISDDVADVSGSGYGFTKTDGSRWEWTRDDPTPQEVS